MHSTHFDVHMTGELVGVRKYPIDRLPAQIFLRGEHGRVERDVVSQLRSFNVVLSCAPTALLVGDGVVLVDVLQLFLHELCDSCGPVCKIKKKKDKPSEF